jgi:hypothetical protein
MRGMLWALRWEMLEELEGSSNVARHGDIQEPVTVVPGESNATVELVGPVDTGLVVGVERRQEVFDACFAGVAHTQVIDDEGTEDGGAGGGVKQ